VSLGRLFFAIAVIAVGLAIVGQVLQTNSRDVAHLFPLLVVCWFAGATLIGFGLLHPFKRGWLGAIFALVVQSIVFVAYLSL
jgi:hypothetical protein